MFVAYINDNYYSVPRYGTLFGSFLTKEKAAQVRTVSGDLVFNDDGTINQEDFWLFDWEKQDENCYARKQQKANLNVSKFYFMTELRENRRFAQTH